MITWHDITFLYMTWPALLIHLSLQHHQQKPATFTSPLFRGMWAAPSQATGELGVEKHEGGPRKWEAQVVCHKNGQQHLSLPVFSCFFSLHPSLMSIAPRLSPPPPPSHQNTSQRWLLLSFQHDFCCHHLPHVQRWARGGLFLFFWPNFHHHLPHIQTWAGGGFFWHFNLSLTTTTFLMSKYEPKVVSFILSTWLLPPPPPSHSNTSWRWSFSMFQYVSHHNHLPHIQIQARDGWFHRFDTFLTTTTSLRAC